MHDYLSEALRYVSSRYGSIMTAAEHGLLTMEEARARLGLEELPGRGSVVLAVRTLTEEELA